MPHRTTHRPFNPTRWTHVRQLQAGGASAPQALGELCQAYWFPLYSWARSSGSSPADAEDLVQGFFADVVRKNLFTRAEPARGRLRTFLLTSFRRYRRDQLQKDKTLRRGTGRVVSFDAHAGESAYLSASSHQPDPNQLYDRQWALNLLDRALRSLADAYASHDRISIFQRLHPYLRDETTDSYTADAAALDLTPAAVKVAVHRLRSRFRDHLRAEVAATGTPESDIDSELRHLLGTLGT